MDLDVMASVQDNIIGNCLCLLGDSMPMPVASMIKRFRPEFEQHMEQARIAAAESVSEELDLAVPAKSEAA